MLRRLLLATLLGVPALAHAQAEYRFTEYQPFTYGFTTTLLFRNVNSYTDPSIIFVEGFGVKMAAGPRPTAPAPSGAFYLSGRLLPRNAGRGAAGFIPGGWAAMAWHWCVELSSECTWPNGNECMGIRYSDPHGYDLLGCQVPAFPGPQIYPWQGYIGRTCDGAGHTGWVTIALRVTAENFNQSPLVFGESDLEVSFTNTVVAGPNALNVVPGPSTYTMLAVGLVILGVVRRRRR